MKFGDKYELLESLTTGAVETFAANDKVRGERVLVHIVECSPPKPNQTTAEWALESFRQLAPDPVGPILETGKYSGTLYAYLVSKVPDENAVKNWVRRYELQTQDTQESLTAPTPIQSAPSSSPPPVARNAAPHIPGPMTQLLRDFESQSKARTVDAGAKETAPAVEKEPAPTPLPLPNLSMPGGSGLHAASPWDPFSARPSAPHKKDEPIGANSGIFSPQEYSAKPLPQDAPIKDASKPGEFTSFFQGPFRGDGPSEMPNVSSQPVEAPRKSVGEFTAVFGQLSPPQPTPEPLESNGNKLSSPSFTGMFEGVGNSSPGVGASMPTPVGVSAKDPVAPGAKANLSSPPPFAAPSPAVGPNALQPPAYVEPTVPPVPTPSLPIAPAENPRPGGPSSLAGDGATRAFARPNADHAPAQPEIDPGPSSYTRIISPVKLRPPTHDESAASLAGGTASSKSAAPAMPKIAPPTMPAPPKIAAPKAPKLPTVDVPPPPSYWPLVLTLTVLLFVAVLLVLYFVLRH